MSESLAPQTPPEPDTPPTTVAARLDLLHRAGGIAVPVATGVLAFAIGGLVVLASGHNPLLAYRDILNGAGLNWIVHPWDTDTINTAPYNLTQTLLQTTTLILTGLAVAFAFRCGMFNIGGQGQYFMGLFVASWVGTRFVDMTRPCTSCSGSALPCSQAPSGRDRRLPQSCRRRPRGDHDDHAELDRVLDRGLSLRPGRAAPGRREQGAEHPDLRRHRTEREAARLLGRPRPPGACTSASSSRLPP
jgi:hypothetical protein